jgi:3-deoxy-D-manno-octulosonate 8-phosphate phosphatase (KDO 8-P phosphatase)
VSRSGESAVARARTVRLMAFDVDGVLTDGTLFVAAGGEEFKAFNILDGHGLRMLRDNGVQLAILSGRESQAVTRRAQELGIEQVVQGLAQKLPAFEALCARSGIKADECGFVGDDYPDLPVLLRCGFAATVPGAPEAVRSRVHYVTRAAGGRGAVREICEFVLEAQGKLDAALGRYLA